MEIRKDPLGDESFIINEDLRKLGEKFVEKISLGEISKIPDTDLNKEKAAENVRNRISQGLNSAIKGKTSSEALSLYDDEKDSEDKDAEGYIELTEKEKDLDRINILRGYAAGCTLRGNPHEAIRTFKLIITRELIRAGKSDEIESIIDHNVDIFNKSRPYNRLESDVVLSAYGFFWTENMGTYEMLPPFSEIKKENREYNRFFAENRWVIISTNGWGKKAMKAFNYNKGILARKGIGAMSLDGGYVGNDPRNNDYLFYDNSKIDVIRSEGHTTKNINDIVGGEWQLLNLDEFKNKKNVEHLFGFKDKDPKML